MSTTTSTVRQTRLQQAESRLLVIRNALTVADEELSRALAERDWEVFGLATFGEYCAEKLPELEHIKLRVAPRQARTKALLEADPTVTEREIAAATGASPATAHRDVLAVTGRAVASNEAGPQPPVTAPPVPQSGYRAAVALVAAQGAHGLTVKELAAATGWHHGQASGALSKAARKQLIRARPTFRDGCAAYVAS